MSAYLMRMLGGLHDVERDCLDYLFLPSRVACATSVLSSIGFCPQKPSPKTMSTTEEKLQKGKDLKDQGNDAFKEGKLKEGEYSAPHCTRRRSRAHRLSGHSALAQLLGSTTR